MRFLRAPAVIGVVSIAAFFSITSAQATFSIVAVDTRTGEVGGAGASCINGAFIINDLLEGVGAIHTQAYWNSRNQTTARAGMVAGDSPEDIILFLIANDAGGFGCAPGGPNCNASHRQYGIVDLNGGSPRSAAHTGSNNSTYANHITGLGYSIQGNILPDTAQYDVLGSMEIAFLNTPGPLADRLMAALQAANVAGADRRCLANGKPAISAFIKVVRIGDGGTPYLELDVGTTTVPENPIDILQGLYDAWKTGLATEPDPFLSSVSAADAFLRPNGKSQTVITVVPRNNSGADLGPGLNVTVANSGSGILGAVADIGDGTYTAVLTAPTLAGTDTIMATCDGAAGPVALGDEPVVEYKKRRSSGGGGCAGTLVPIDPGSAVGGLLPLLALLAFLLLWRGWAPGLRRA